MKKLLLIITIYFTALSLQAQDSLNMSLNYNWVDTSGLYFNTYFGIKHYFNEVWGWHNDSTGEEYAIMGAADATYFYNVTDVDSCYLIDTINAKDRADIHRDYKSYLNYVYMVADEGSNSLQIYDMSTLPDSVTLVYDDDEFVIRSHNIYIEEGILYMVSPAAPGDDPTGFRMLDLTIDPTNPTLIADFNLPNDGSQGNHIHDMYVKNDKAYCSNGNAGYYIYDISDKQNIFTLGQIDAYTEQGYNHNSWMNEDCSTIFFTDENLGMGIKSYNITDLDNITFNKVFRSNVGAMAHNVVVHGNMLYVSYYHDGVVVFDITDPSNPVLVASYDTFEEQNGYDDYQGAWGVYPFLPSGTILVSDFENGLFVLTIDSSVSPVYSPSECLDTVETNNIGAALSKIKLFPNPANDALTIENGFNGKVDIYNTFGSKIMSKNITPNEALDISPLNKGVYLLQISSEKDSKTMKFIKK